MLRSYPLYEEILSTINKRVSEGGVESGIDVQRLCKTINDFSQYMTQEEYMEHYTEIGMLMIHHELVSNGVLFSEAPYNAKLLIGGKGMLITLLELPTLLQKIIVEYIEMQKQ